MKKIIIIITFIGLLWSSCTFAQSVLTTSNGKVLTTSNDLPIIAQFYYDFSSSSLPLGLPFSRASTGLRYNSSGILESIAANTPRFSYNPSTLALLGLLIEPQATNLVIYSEQFNNSAWLKSSPVTVTANSAIAPDGNTTADTITKTADSFANARSSSVVVSSLSPMTGSVYFKAGSLTAASMSLTEGGSTLFARGYINLSTGATVLSIGSSISAIYVGNGWYRLSLTGTPAASTTLYLYVYPDRYNQATAGYVYAWGAQLEVGASATTYIPTTATAVTRAADILTLTIPAGINYLTYIFDNGSTQKISVSTGVYTVPTSLDRSWIQTIIGSGS